MTTSLIKENLSKKYIEIIAHRNGCSISKTENDHGVDLTVNQVLRKMTGMKYRYFQTGRCIDIQLKSTTLKNIEEDEIYIKYDLEVKNYNDLIDRKNENLIPLILILFILPDEETEWVNVSENELVLKKCAYWYYPEGNVCSENSSTQRIHIKKDNIISLNFFNYYFKGEFAEWGLT